MDDQVNFIVIACIITRNGLAPDDYLRAAAHCDRVLSMDAAGAEQREKAQYRKGVAYSHVGDYEVAAQCFEQCSKKSSLIACFLSSTNDIF